MLGACPTTLPGCRLACSSKTIRKILKGKRNEETLVSSFGKFAGYRKKSARRVKEKLCQLALNRFLLIPMVLILVARVDCGIPWRLLEDRPRALRIPPRPAQSFPSPGCVRIQRAVGVKLEMARAASTTNSHRRRKSPGHTILPTAPLHSAALEHFPAKCKIEIVPASLYQYYGYSFPLCRHSAR